MTEVDPTHRLVATSQGKEAGGSLLKVSSAVIELEALPGDQTRLSFDIDFSLLGKRGTLRYPVIKHKAGEMYRRFAENLRKELALSLKAGDPLAGGEAEAPCALFAAARQAFPSVFSGSIARTDLAPLPTEDHSSLVITWSASSRRRSMCHCRRSLAIMEGILALRRASCLLNRINGSGSIWSLFKLTVGNA